jgi:hypothetical protein
MKLRNFGRNKETPQLGVPNQALHADKTRRVLPVNLSRDGKPTVLFRRTQTDSLELGQAIVPAAQIRCQEQLEILCKK